MAARFAALALASLAVSVPVQGDDLLGVLQLIVPQDGSTCSQLHLPQLYHINTISMIYGCSGCTADTFVPLQFLLESNYAGVDAAPGSGWYNATFPMTIHPKPTLPYPQQGQTEISVCAAQPPGGNAPSALTVEMALSGSPANVPLPCSGVDGIAGAKSLCVQRDGPLAIPSCGVKYYQCPDGCISTFNTPLPMGWEVFHAQNHILPYLPYSAKFGIAIDRLYNLTQLTITAASTCSNPNTTVHSLRVYVSSFESGFNLSPRFVVAEGATVTGPTNFGSVWPAGGTSGIYVNIGTSTLSNCGVRVNTSFLGMTTELPHA